jgi:phosphoribosylaminoimidazole (AIR) synthetase
MKKTFNMGIGYVMVVSKGKAEEAVALLKKSGYPSFIIGNTEKGGRGVRYS